MALGAGKYDDLCTWVREETGAEGVVLVVLRGDQGNGFSVQAQAGLHLALPDLLEHLAAVIRADLAEPKH